MYLISNRNLCTEEKYLATIVEASRNGVEYLILREKDLDFESLSNLYKKIVNRLEENSLEINIIVNSSVELYEAYEVDGIHLPYANFKALVEKGYKFKKDRLLGLSLHSVEEVIELENIAYDKNIRVDYITLSHIYETKCKEGLAPRGIELLKESRKHTSIKIVALGGILPENTDEVSMYCDDIAVMSTLFKSSDVGATVKAYTDKMFYHKR